MTAVAVAEETPARVAVTEPGVYDIPEDLYHADPVPAEFGGSLSCSSARWLLPPSVPAKFAHYRATPKPPSAAMELGTAAHKLVLGSGPELVRVDADSWRSNYAKDAARDARARGAVPLLAEDYATVHAMAAALLADPEAAVWLDPSRGAPERSLFWTDPHHGVWLRSRLDLYPHWAPGDPAPVIVDYKTAQSAAPDSFAKSAFDYGYYRQDPFYCAGFRAMHPDAPPAKFLFILQEKEPPFLVNVVQLDAAARRAGAADNWRAIARFAQCTEAGEWPGYEHTEYYDVISLPAWAMRRLDGGNF